MRRIFVRAAIAAVIAVMAPLASFAQQPGPAASAANAFDERAAQLVALFSGQITYDSYFAPSFQTALPEPQFAAITRGLIGQYGRPLAVLSHTSADGWQGRVEVQFEKGVATIALGVAKEPDRRVFMLLVQDFKVSGDSFDRVKAEFAALPGASGFLVAALQEDKIAPVAALNPDAQFAIGSTFKLYVLDELAAQVASGKRKWSDVVRLTHQSFSSAGTANWPNDTAVTLQTLANWMISVSDNSATDTLIHILGRRNVEARMRTSGHSNPSLNTPFLTTVEAFAMKGDNFAAERDAFLKGDDATQEKLLATHADRFVLANVQGTATATPRFIGGLEWFATPSDVARLMVDLRTRKSDELRAALAINNGVGPGPAAGWKYLGYKGGSELGVMSMSLLGQRKSDDKWYVVTASWNNPDAAVSTDTMVALVTRLLALAAN